MNIIDNIKVYPFNDNLYVVDTQIEGKNDPFASLAFLLSLDYNEQTLDLLDKLTQKGINDYINQDILYSDDEATIEEYLKTLALIEINQYPEIFLLEHWA